MVFTNNDEIQAFFIFSAGSYEELWRKHEDMAPPEEICLKYKYTVSNKSVRMSNIQGALLHPQLAVMEERIEQHNSMYYYLKKQTAAVMEDVCGEGSSKRLEFIPQVSENVGPVYDSLQVRILDQNGNVAEKEIDGLAAFLKALQQRKYSIAKFTDPANARNFLSWQYLNQKDIDASTLPQTTHVLANVCDLRLLCQDTEAQMDVLATAIAECFRDSFQHSGRNV